MNVSHLTGHKIDAKLMCTENEKKNKIHLKARLNGKYK